MKSNPKKESGSKKDTSSSKKPSITSNGKNNNEGKEFKGEGHGHDYSTPVAGEDGGTEDQTEPQHKKSKNGSTKN